MRTAAIGLIMLGAITSSFAHPGAHQRSLSQSQVDTVGGTQVPLQGWRHCNGGACTLTGGPSGGPNQT